MARLVDVAGVVRILVEFFSADSEPVANKALEGVTVKGMALSQLKNEMLIRPEVERTIKRFRINPFDMENVFDLEDVLKKALEQHPVFAQPNEDFSESDLVAEQNQSALLVSGAEGDGAMASDSETVPEPGGVISDKDNVNALASLVRYMQWANKVFYAACSELPDYELTRNRPMLFDNILNLLNHIHTMDLVWKAHLEGEEHGFTSRCPMDKVTFAELSLKQSELDVWYVTYAEGLPPEQSIETVNFEFIGGGAGAMTRTDILHHVVNHTSYHRGHIEGVFYQLGIEPPTTDLPVFVRLNQG